MNLAFDRPAVRLVLPRTWEFFRAGSGLVAIVVLVGVVTNTPQLADQRVAPAPEAGDFSVHAPEESRTARLLNTSFLDSTTRTLVFYLVSTREQEEFTDWAEQIGAMQAYNGGQPMADRHYFILYARSDEEEQTAGRTILQTVVGLVDAALVEVIDLRSITAGRSTSTMPPADRP